MSSHTFESVVTCVMEFRVACVFADILSEVRRIAGDWFNYERGLEPVVAFGAIGVGVACYVVAGLVVVNELRSERMMKRDAVLHLVTGAGVATVLPFFIVLGISESMRHRKGGLFQGEHGLWFGAIAFDALCIAVCLFTVFIICVFSVSRSKSIERRPD